MAGAEVLDRLVAGVVTDFKFYRIQAECEAKSRELRAECEARTLEKMLQILKRMQQAVGNLKVSIEAKESVDIATQESEPMVQLSTQPDSIIENVKEVSVMVTEDSENGENTMEIISTDIVVVQNTPGVCQNVPMAWYSHFAMLMDFGCNLNRIWRQNKLVRLGKPPAKPPDYVLLHFWGFIDHLVSLEMVKKSTVNVGYLWKRMRTKYVQPVTIIYGVLVVARAAKVLGDPFQVAPQTRRRMIFYNIHLGFHCYMGMIELLNCAVGFGPGQQNPAPPISEELSKKIIDQLRTSREEVAKLTSDGPPRTAETQIGVAEDAGVSKLDGVPRASEARRVADIKVINVPSGGSGRGKLEKPAASDVVQVREPGYVGEANRHMKVARHQARDPTTPRLPPEEAVQKAMEILRKKSEASGDRGRVGGRGRGFARARGHWRKDEEDEEVDMYLGDDTDGEKRAKRPGPEMMNQLTEVFEEAFNNVSPSPMHEAYEDALQTNYAIELFRKLTLVPTLVSTEYVFASVINVCADVGMAKCGRQLQRRSYVDYDAPSVPGIGMEVGMGLTYVLGDKLTFNIKDSFVESDLDNYATDLLIDAQSRHAIFCDDFLVKAFREAEKAHREHMRASGDPYLQHYVETALSLALIGAASTVVAAGLQHDSIDDSFISYEYISTSFGAEVADLVKGSFYFQVSKLSHLSKLAHENDTACKTAVADCLHTMFLTMEDAKAVLIKLVDCLHNMVTLDVLPSAKQHRIAKEILEIFVPLANHLGISTWKVQIENMCFKHLNPDQHKDMSSKVEKSFDKEMVMSAVEKSKQNLKDTGLHYHDISGRHESLFSIYSKMMKKKLNMNEIHDIHGLRLILEKEEDFYKALEVAHQFSKEVLVEAVEPHSQLKLNPRIPQDSVVKIVNEHPGAFTLLVRLINELFIFSLPRPPEVDDLEDKVGFKGRGMMHVDIGPEIEMLESPSIFLYINVILQRKR